MEKLSFFDFVKKMNFILGEKIKLDDFSSVKVNLYHIKEFENLSNEEFIENMYKIILQRVADEFGKKSKIEELEKGKNRNVIIEEMKNSPEGQNYIGKYELLGVKNINFIDKNIFYKEQYTQDELDKLIQFMNYKLRNLVFTGYIIDLLHFSGTEFIYLLYQLLLQREPDLEGFNSHLSGSYILEDKLEKIFVFLHSEEAKSKQIVFKDLSDENILNYENYKQINYTEPTPEAYHIIRYSFEIENKKVIHLNEMIDMNVNKLFVKLAEFTKTPYKTFKFLCEESFLKQKTILDMIYNENFLSILKENVLIIDFFSKPIKKDFNVIEDYMRNMSVYYSEYKNFENNLFLNYNFSLLKKYIDNELFLLISHLKKFAYKEEVKKLFDIDQFIIEKINALSEIIKEHEQSLIEIIK